jgi:hypothetical protein
MTSSHENPPLSGRSEIDSSKESTQSKEPSEDEVGAERENGAVAGEDGYESCGPLTFERHRKEDGRALILYSHVEDDTDAGAPPHPESTGDTWPEAQSGQREHA